MKGELIRMTQMCYEKYLTYFFVEQSSSDANFQLTCILIWFTQREEKSSQIGRVSAYTDKYSTKGTVKVIEICYIAKLCVYELFSAALKLQY